MSEDAATPAAGGTGPPSRTPAMRASDADRDAVASRLQAAMAEGRLDPVEFQTRLDAALAARTLADLEPLTRDLPAPAPAAPVPGRRGVLDRTDAGTKAAWAAWLSASLVCTIVYLLSNAGGYFWPAWVAGPWGAVLLARTLTGPGAPKERPGRRDGERDHL